MSAISLILKGRGDFFFDNFLHFCTIFQAAICALLVFLGAEGPEGMLFKSLILVSLLYSTVSKSARSSCNGLFLFLAKFLYFSKRF